MAQRQFPAAFDGIAQLPETSAAPNRIPPLWGSARLKYTICAFLAMAAQACLQNAFNLAIWCMVEHNETDYGQIYSEFDVNDTCEPIDMRTTQYEYDNLLYWSQSEIYLVLGSYFFGYVIMSPYAGRLVDKIGGKWFLISSIALQSLIVLFIPIYAYESYLLAVILRFMQGLIASFAKPAIYQLFTVWAHTNERTAFVSFAHGGNSFGPLLMYSVSSVLCQFGWPFIFLFVGTVSSLVTATCFFWVENKLEDDPDLPQDEYNYLKRSNTREPNDNIPWKDILSSAPLYAFLCIHLTHNYGLLMLTLLLPKFFHQTMRFPFDIVGLISAAPFLGAFGSKSISIYISNILEKTPNLNFTNYRRRVSIVCTICALIFAYGIILCSCHERVIVVILTMLFGAAIDMATSYGYLPSLFCMAPSFVGFITGIANSLGALSGFLAPMALSNILYYGSKSEWNLIISSTMFCYSLGVTIFAAFGSSEPAPWDQKVNMPNEEIVNEEILAEVVEAEIQL